MADYKELFIQYLDEKNVKYTDVDDFVVNVSFSGDNMQSIPVYVLFDQDRDPIVQLKCWNIINFKDKRDKAVEACNQVNSEYRWVKFFIDDDNDIIASIDAYIDEVTGGPECFNLVQRMVGIVDDSYPTFAKAMWA